MTNSYELFENIAALCGKAREQDGLEINEIMDTLLCVVAVGIAYHAAKNDKIDIEQSIENMGLRGIEWVNLRA